MAADGTRAWISEIKESKGTVRFRATTGAVLVVGVALVIAALIMVVLMQRSLISGVQRSVFFRIRNVETTLEADGQPRGGSLECAGFARGEDEEFAQVFDQQGDLVCESANLERAVFDENPLDELSSGERTQFEVSFELDDGKQDFNPFLAIAASRNIGGSPHNIVVGRTLETVFETRRVVVGLLVGGIPLILGVVGTVTWRVVGRALAPVESIRNQVEAISMEELYRRVPAPPTEDEIGRLAMTMNQMLERLEEGQSRQRRFVSDASHELRSPVASIRQHSEVALAHPGNASAEELARVVLDENLRMQRLVEDLLLLARMDEHKVDARREMLDLDDVLFEEVNRVRHVTDKTIDASGVSAGRVLGDRKQLTILTGNILDNAVRHARESVSVALTEEDHEVVFQVDDDGDGIPPEEEQRIFERFVRLQEARDRDSGGSGLGLAIVAEVAGAHGGTARVLKSRLGGALFEIRLPRASD